MKIQAALFTVFLATVSFAAAENGQITEMGEALASKDRCAICHKERGMAQPLAGLAEGKTDDFLKQAIVNPKEALGPATRMPAYDYSDEEIEALIAYLRSLSKP